MWQIILPHNLFHFFKSFLYFCFIRKNDHKVLFYSPQHFNRGVLGVNNFIKPLIETTERKGISSWVIEEPSYESNYPRRKVVQFDFILLLINFLRKVLKGDFIEKENKIGKLLGRIFFRNKIEHIVVQSQSMVSFFRGVYPNAKIYDYQHGVIYKDHPAYCEGKNVPELIKRNNVYVLVFGSEFKKLLESLNSYYIEHSLVIGANKEDCTQNLNGEDILITLQFTEDHTPEENKELLKDLQLFIQQNPNERIVLKHHPRFNNEINNEELLKYSNVSISQKPLPECFKSCKIHATAYSTTVFEAAALKLPSVFYSEWKIEIYKNQFTYPINSLKDTLRKYNDLQLEIEDWYKKYYEPLNEITWLKIVQ